MDTLVLSAQFRYCYFYCIRASFSAATPVRGLILMGAASEVQNALCCTSMWEIMVKSEYDEGFPFISVVWKVTGFKNLNIIF